MKETKKNSPKVPAGSMIDQKTNEDFNKKKPDPSDPNEQKDRPKIDPPNFEEDEIVPAQSGTPDKSSGQQKPPNKSEGSE